MSLSSIRLVLTAFLFAVSLFFFYVYYKSRSFLSISSIGFLTLNGLELQTANINCSIRSISITFFSSGLKPVAIRFDQVAIHVKKAERVASTTTLSPKKFVLLHRMLLQVFDRDLVRLLLDWFQVRFTGLSFQIEEILLLNVKMLDVTASNIEHINGVQYLFKNGATRLFQLSIEIDQFSVVDSFEKELIDTMDIIQASVIFGNISGSSVCVPGILLTGSRVNINMCNIKEAQDLINMTLSQEVTALKNQAHGSFVESLQDFFLLQYPIVLPLMKLFPPIAFIIPQIALSCKAGLDEQKSALIIFQTTTTVIVPNSFNPLHFSIHFNIEKGSLDLLPDQGQIFTLSALSIWNEIKIQESNTLFPAQLPYKIDVDSFLTLTQPTGILPDKLIFEFIHQTRYSKSCNSPSPSIEKCDVSFLANLFRVKIRIHLLDYKLSVKIPSDKDFNHSFIPSVYGEQICFSIISIPKQDAAFVHPMLNVSLEHTKLSISCDRLDHSFDFTSENHSIPPLLILPSSQTSLLISSDFNLEGFLNIPSIQVDLSSISINLPHYEELVFILMSNFTKLQLNSSVAEPSYPKYQRLLPFAFNLQIHLISIKFCQATKPHHSSMLVWKKLAARLAFDGILASFVELGEFKVQTNPADYATDNFTDWKDIHLVQKGLGNIIQGTAKEIIFHVDLSKIYVLIKSCAFIFRLINIIKSQSTAVDSEGPKKSDIDISFKVSQIQMHVELPESIKGSGIFSMVDLHAPGNGSLSAEVKLFNASIFKDIEKQMVELAVLTNISLRVITAALQKPMLVYLSSASSKLVIPNDWPFSNILENGINLSRAVKPILYECIEKEAPKYFSSGNTFLLPAETPSFFIKSEFTEILIQDNLFESFLGRNYALGYDENLARLAREKEFMKKAKTRFPTMTELKYRALKASLYAKRNPKDG